MDIKDKTKKRICVNPFNPCTKMLYGFTTNRLPSPRP